MKLKSRFLAIGSAIAMAAFATSANAGVLIQGTGFWDTTTSVTDFSAPSSSFQFSFELPNPLDSNPTTSFSNLTFTLGSVLVDTSPASIQFYGSGNGGLFDLNFGSTTISFYGTPIGDTGTVGPAGGYSFLSDIDFTSGRGGGTGTGFLTVSALAAVPEPTTWAMMAIGLSAVGFAMRRQRVRSLKVSYA